MADYYLQFSEVIDHLSTDEEAWLCRQLEYIFVFGDQEYGEDNLPAGLDPDDADWEGIRAWRNHDDIEDSEDVGFDYAFGDDRSGDWGRQLWLYRQESGDVERVACLVQQFLKQFRPDHCWSLTYSRTCSKLRVGAFTGGAVFVTAEEIEWETARQFVDDRRKLFNSQRGKKARRGGNGH